MKPLNGNGSQNSGDSQQDISSHPNGNSPPDTYKNGSENHDIKSIKDLVIVKNNNVINSDKRNSINQKCINCEINGKYYSFYNKNKKNTRFFRFISIIFIPF